MTHAAEQSTNFHVLALVLGALLSHTKPIDTFINSLKEKTNMQMFSKSQESIKAITYFVCNFRVFQTVGVLIFRHPSTVLLSAS